MQELKVLIISVLILVIPVALFCVATYKVLEFISYLYHKSNKYKNKLIASVEDNIEFNELAYKYYLGNTKEKPKQLENEIAICKSYNAEYLKKIGLDDGLIQRQVESGQKALKQYEIYEKEFRRKDIDKRLKFIEEELMDVKQRVK